MNKEKTANASTVAAGRIPIQLKCLLPAFRFTSAVEIPLVEQKYRLLRHDKVAHTIPSVGPRKHRKKVSICEVAYRVAVAVRKLGCGGPKSRLTEKQCCAASVAFYRNSLFHSVMFTSKEVSLPESLSILFLRNHDISSHHSPNFRLFGYLHLIITPMQIF